MLTAQLRSVSILKIISRVIEKIKLQLSSCLASQCSLFISNIMIPPPEETIFEGTVRRRLFLRFLASSLANKVFTR